MEILKNFMNFKELVALILHDSNAQVWLLKKGHTHFCTVNCDLLQKMTRC